MRADTIGLWQFETGYGDATGEHDGILNITDGLVSGPPCGLALQLDPGNYIHFTMGIAANGQAWARLQYGGAEAYRCSAGPIPGRDLVR